MVCAFSDSEPTCHANVSLPGNVVDVSDHIEIQCSVRYNGSWTPAFACVPHLPGTSNTQNSPAHIQYTRVIAASDIDDDFAVLNCSMTFSLATDYRVMFPGHVKPEKPVYEFFWSAPPIRIVSARGRLSGLQIHRQVKLIGDRAPVQI